jgi:hypothetical protein
VAEDYWINFPEFEGVRGGKREAKKEAIGEDGLNLTS